MPNLFRLVFAGYLLLIGQLCLAQSPSEPKAEIAVAVFAGGCFWCMEPPYDKVNGVVSTTSGYIGGKAETAVYKQVASGHTAHVEAIKIEYDANKVNFSTLLEIFWKNVDPFDAQGQFCDKGPQYLSYIYYKNDEEKMLAEKSLAQLRQRFDEPIATQILPVSAFYPAEDYHQDYYQKNPIRYKFYRSRCGRDSRLNAVWGD